MNYLFLYASTVLCGAYFLGRKRRIDFLLVYFISLFCFSLSVYFGLVYDPFGKGFITAQYETSVVYGVAYLGLLFVGIMNDVELERFYYPPGEIAIEKGLSRGGKVLLLALFFVLSLAIFIKLVPVYLSAAYKRQALEQVGFSLMLMSSCVVSGFGLSLVFKNKFFTVAFSTFLLLLFLWGTRSPAVFAFFIYFVFRFGDRKVMALKKAKIMVFLLCFALIIAVGKNFYGEVVYGGRGVVVWFNEYSLEKMLTGMEFMYTPAILDKVIEKDFSVGFISVVKSFLGLLPLPSSVTGNNPSYFNDIFQPALFPGIEYGMAFNPWAEAYSWMKWLGVIIYSFFIPFLIVLVNLAIYRNRGRAISVLFMVLGVMFAFWIHRNSLGSIFAYARNGIYPFLGLYIACYFVDCIFLRRFRLRSGG